MTTAVPPLPGLAGPVSAYARRLHAAIGDGHHVASPLGAWLLLALCGPAATGESLAGLTEVLGCDAGPAAGAAADLLASPHPLVAAAAAAWSRPGSVSAAWLAGLPATVATGPVPDQAAADDWARRQSFRMIDGFPARLGESVSLVLASLLATRVSWQVPFELAPASALGLSSAWAGRVQHVLRTPRQHHQDRGHEQFIAVTPEVGDVAVHLGRAAGGLLVVSAAAAPGVPAADVLAAAHCQAIAAATGTPVPRRSLFDLPLGDGPLCTVREEKSGTGRAELCTAVLPAWSAASRHDLGRPGLGFDLARRALTNDVDPWRAEQVAVARYSRFGFEAAAVSAMAVAASVRRPSGGLRRVAVLRFGHPFAVVAVTEDGRDAGSGAGPWQGLPVFSAWVTEPEDAGDESSGERSG